MPETLPPIETPSPCGAVGRFMTWALGPSYRSSIAGIVTGVSVVAAAALALCPTLIGGKWNTREFITLVLSVIAGGGATRMGFVSKDKLVSGVETKASN